MHYSVESKLSSKENTRNAFSLLELLTCLGVIGLILGISLPSLRQAKEYSRRVLCRSQLKEIGLAENAYSVDYSRKLWNTDIPAGLNNLENQSEYELSSLFLCPSDRQNKVEKLDNYLWNNNNSLHASYTGRYLEKSIKKISNPIVFADLNHNYIKLIEGSNHGKYDGYNGSNEGKPSLGVNALFLDNSTSWLPSY